MKTHLKDLAKEVKNFFLKNYTKINVLDIGCNDGTLLNYFDKKFQKHGIDPSQIIKKIKDKKNKNF